MGRMLAMVTDGFGGHGGIARYNCDFLSALAAGNWQITVVPRYAPEPEVPPAGIDQRPARAGRMSYARTVCLEALWTRPRIVFCGHLFMAPLGVIAAKLAGAQLIIQTHGIEAWQRPGKLVRASSAAAALILSVSRYTRAQVLTWADVAPERVVVLPNTFGAGFAPGPSPDRGRWGVAGRSVLLTVGRMDAREGYKGHEKVICAMPALLAAGHDVVYLVVGEGDDRQRLERIAARCGMDERVRFVGAVSRDALIELYRLADLFVMPSGGEGFGIAYVEAMACGTPALGLGFGGARDALGDGGLGIMVEPDEDLAARIGAALTSPGLRGAALAAAVESRFGPTRFAARACHLLERVEAARRGPVSGGTEGHCGR